MVNNSNAANINSKAFTEIKVMDCASSIEELASKVDTLEILNHAMWLVLEEMGATHESLNAKIFEVMNTKRESKSMKLDMFCSFCHQRMQVSKGFKCKCIYCGNEVMMNPYQLQYEKINNTSNDDGNVAIDSNGFETNEATEPYDVNKDLGFDM